MSRTDVWMPLYIGDYLADTMHLDGEQHGPYLLLIMHYWRNGPLPDDDRALAAIARVSPTVWDRRISKVVRAFFSCAGGKLFHKRVDAELAHAALVSSKRQAAAIARHSKSKDAAKPVQETCKPDAIAQQMDTQSQSHIQKKEVGKEESQVRLRASRLPPDWKPTLDDCMFASELGLDAVWIAGGFRDYWHSKAGANARKTDWTMTWRNWCRRASEQKRPTCKPVEKLGFLMDYSDISLSDAERAQLAPRRMQ